MCSAHGLDVPSTVPGSTDQSRTTVPETPSIRRASSSHGRRPATPVTSASVTSTVPVAVVNVVSSTLVPGRYRRVDSKSLTGCSSIRPPFSPSSSAAKTGGESRLGMGSQSTVPERSISATVRPSPNAA